MVSDRISDLADLGSGRCTSAPIAMMSCQRYELDGAALLPALLCDPNASMAGFSNVSVRDVPDMTFGFCQDFRGGFVLPTSRSCVSCVLSGAELPTSQTFGGKDE